MNNDQVKGRADQLVGAVKEATGKVTKNDKLKNKGKAQKAGGTVKAAYGDLKEDIKKI